jgi:hypothetical protein
VTTVDGLNPIPIPIPIPNPNSVERENTQEKDRKTKFAERVFLFQNEFDKLVEKFGEKGAQDRITKLSLYKQSHGKKYKSDYATILHWELSTYSDNGRKNNGQNGRDPNKYTQGKYGHMVQQ